MPGGRGHVDDAPPLPLHHPGHDRLQAMEAAGEMHVQHLAPLLDLHLVQHRGPGDARIVDQDVDAPEPRRHGGGHALDLVTLRHVARDADRIRTVAAQRRGERFGAFLREIHHRDPRALGRIGTRHRRTDALRGTRHDRRPACELHSIAPRSRDARCAPAMVPAVRRNVRRRRGRAVDAGQGAARATVNDTAGRCRWVSRLSRARHPRRSWRVPRVRPPAPPAAAS